MRPELEAYEGEDRRRFLRRRPEGLDLRIPGVLNPIVVGLSPAGMRTVSDSGLDEADGDGEAVQVTLSVKGDAVDLRGRLVWHEILLTPQGRRYVSGVEFLDVDEPGAAHLHELADQGHVEWLVGDEAPV